MTRNTEGITKQFEECGITVIPDAPMDRYTSFRAGGCADALVIPEDPAALKRVLEILARSGCPHMILGNGSNILVRDGGYRGVMVHCGENFGQIRREGDDLICGSGALLSAAARTAQSEGLAGIAFASGIPGSIGGAVFMNAGAYGGEIRDVLKEARVLSADGREEKTLTPDDLEMGYRHSKLQESGDVVIEVRLALMPGDPEAIREEMAELTAKRNAKQPVNLPSAGSFFKRPEGYFAGKLIQDAGLKGLRVGDAQVSELHSGFIVNRGKATATEILQLMEIVQASVLEQFGVMLEPEVRIVGE
ncbi:MAG: UDP-N-acetylmuramate dehydrogenase [Firmicutes bacterium]|nr:UDP-N-acetylmuramate dehydrogenase [Bacillota bacterium]